MRAALTTPTGAAPTALVARGVTKSFDDQVVLSEIDLVAEPGALTLVHGGSGRTTLLRCLAGTYRPSSGQVLLRREDATLDLVAASPRQLAWARRQWIALFDGAFPAAPRSSAGSAVARRAGATASQVAAGFERLGLARLREVPMGRLRPEQARQMGLLAGLLHPGSVLLLDSPLPQGAGVAEWVEERRRSGDTIVVAAAADPGWSHDAAAVLDRGRIQWQQQ